MRTGQTSPSLAQGNALHEALDVFFGLPDEHRNVEHLHRALRAKWAKHRQAFAGHDEAQYGRDALRMLDIFARNNDLHARPLSRERWCKAILPGGQTLNGKIDRIDINESGQLDIIDYKAGNRVLTPSQLAQDNAARIYAVLAAGSLELTVERVRWIYLRAGIEICWSPTPDELVAAKDWMVGMIETISADQEFAPSPGHHCQWCPHQAFCDANGVTSLDDLICDEELPF